MNFVSRDLDKMAEDREPPPLFEDEKIATKQDDNEDLFTSVSEVWLEYHLSIMCIFICTEDVILGVFVRSTYPNRDRMNQNYCFAVIFGI